VAAALAVAFALWLPIAAVRGLLPDRWEPAALTNFSFTDVLGLTTLIALRVIQTVLPAWSRGSFFLALTSRDPKMSEELMVRPEVRGIWAQLREMIVLMAGKVLIAVVLIAAIIAVIVLVTPTVIVALGSLMVVLTPVGAIVLLVVLVGAAVALGT